VIPAQTTRFGVGEILPGSVTVTPDSTAFLVSLDPVSFSETLGGLCPACVPLAGSTVPKPAFNGGFTSILGLDPRIVSVTVVGGELVVEVENGLNFDPLNPAGGAPGIATFTLADASDGDQMALLTLDGTDTALPPGGTLTRSAPLLPGTVEGDLEITVQVDSPEGDAVTVDPAMSMAVTASTQDLLVSQVRADVSGEEVALDPVDLGMEEIDQAFTDRIVRGALVVDVVNPFAIGGSLDIVIEDLGSGNPYVEKTAVLGPGPESRLRIELAREEFQTFLGRPGVFLSGRARLAPDAGVVTMTPGQELVVEVSFDLTVEVGG
jgi:hypothetical protein